MKTVLDEEGIINYNNNYLLQEAAYYNYFLRPASEKDKNGKTDFRYPNLLRLSILYRILAWVALGSALICSIWIAVGDYYFPWFLKIIFVLLIFFGGVISYITFQAFADGIHVFMDIEKNTREGRQKK